MKLSNGDNEIASTECVPERAWNIKKINCG